MFFSCEKLPFLKEHFPTRQRSSFPGASCSNTFSRWKGTLAAASPHGTRAAHPDPTCEAATRPCTDGVSGQLCQRNTPPRKLQNVNQALAFVRWNFSGKSAATGITCICDQNKVSPEKSCQSARTWLLTTSRPLPPHLSQTPLLTESA